MWELKNKRRKRRQAFLELFVYFHELYQPVKFVAVMLKHPVQLEVLIIVFLREIHLFYHNEEH